VAIEEGIVHTGAVGAGLELVQMTVIEPAHKKPYSQTSCVDITMHHLATCMLMQNESNYQLQLPLCAHTVSG
jgi:hypothetical protein